MSIGIKYAYECFYFILSSEINVYQLRNEFQFSGVHGAMNRSGSRAK